MSLSMLLLLSRILIRPFRIFDFNSYFVVLGKGNGSVIGLVQSIFNSSGSCSLKVYFASVCCEKRHS